MKFQRRQKALLWSKGLKTRVAKISAGRKHSAICIKQLSVLKTYFVVF